MRKTTLRMIIPIMGCLILAGCGNTVSIDTADDVETVTEAEEDEEEVSEDADKDKNEDPVVETSEEEVASGAYNVEENPYDGGPDWESLADSFILPTKQMSVEDAVSKYAITLTDGGKYADYEGDIGDVIPEYKDRDLDGDHKPDVIRREGQHYVIEFSAMDPLKTGDYSNMPNEGEVIQFSDEGCRNFDEIEIVHYVFGTGGPTVTEASIYSYQKGKWKEFPVIDKDGVICSTQLQGLIAKETGKPYEAGCVRVVDVHMAYMLLDLGSKDGADQTTDYRTSYLYMNFIPEYLKEGDFECSGLNLNSDLIMAWPFEPAGEAVDLKGDTGQGINVFLSNFSEQNFKEKNWPADYAHFVLEWCKLNDPSSVHYSNDMNGIDSEKMFEILDRYFGTNFEEGDYYDLTIDNPYHGTVEYDESTTWYYEPAADGEMFKYNHFTVASDAQLIKGQYYDFIKVPFKIYALTEDDYELNGISKKHYSLTAAEADKLASSGQLILQSEGLAYLEIVPAERSKNGYWLGYYNVFE